MQPRQLALTTLFVGTLAGALAPSRALAVPDGGYLAIGVGGAVVSGERGVSLAPSDSFHLNVSPNSPAYDEIVRTDIDGGLAVELRFGYLIAGVLAPEISLGGHGNLDFSDGAGQATFILRYHPIAHLIPLASRGWDANLYVGGGYAIAGFHPDARFDDDGKGWEGFNLTFGLGASVQVGRSISLGADLRFVLPQYGTYLWNRNKGIEFDTAETPSTLFVVPTAQIIFHL